MPYSSEHKRLTREKIVESARILFNRYGFQDVTIDMVMRMAKLTRGGFYNHFKSKDELYSAAVSSFLMGRGAQWRHESGVDPKNPSLDMAHNMIEGYLSTEHLGDRDGQCPLIALPSDVSRASPKVKRAYQDLLTAMVSLFENSLKDHSEVSREKALSLAALCVGGMVLARALPDSELADEVRVAALDEALGLVSQV